MLRVIAFSVAALSLSAAGRADEPAKSGQGEPRSPGELRKIDHTLLVGKWVRTDKYVGTTMEYARNGTYVTTSVPRPGQRPAPMPGTWRKNGDQLIQTLGPFKTNTSVTITKLTETEFHFRNHAGQEATYERATGKK